MTKIRSLLASRGMRVSELCRATGISEATAYSFVNRQRALPRHWREPFAELLGVAVEEIMEANGLALLDEDARAA